jgi:hemolysin activation/secretion protein
MSIGLEHPFVRTRAVNLYGHAKFDARDVRSRNDLELTRVDRLRVVRAGVRSEFLDNVIGVGINALSFEASKGLDILGASDEGDANMSRSDGDPQFAKATAEIQRLQRLTEDFNLLVGARGQISDGPLLSSEEFGVGGFNIGRGYDPSEIVGDEGVAGKLELQWNSPHTTPLVEKYQVFGFYDIGKIWNDDPTTAADKTNSVASAGVGVRADIVNDMKAGVAVAYPLTRDVETEDDKDPRFYMNLSKQF